MSESKPADQEVAEYKFGPYVLQLRPKNKLVPGKLYKVKEHGPVSPNDEVKRLQDLAQACRLLVYLLEHRETGVDASAVKDLFWGKKDRNKKLSGSAAQSAVAEDKNYGRLVKDLRQILEDTKKPYKYIQRGEGRLEFICPVEVLYSQPQQKNLPVLHGQPAFSPTLLRTKIMIAASEVGPALEENRWGDIVRITEPILPFLDDPILADWPKQLSLLRAFYAIALLQLEQFEELAEYLIRTDVEEAMSVIGRPLSQLTALTLSLLTFELTRRQALADEAQHRIWPLVAINPEEYLDTTASILAIAKILAERSSMDRSYVLVNELLINISGAKDPEVRAVRAEAWSCQIRYCVELRKPGEALESYEGMQQEFCEASDDVTLGHLVWAGTEATRALRQLGRHTDADALANSLAQRFDGVGWIVVKKALAWALLERYQTCEASEDFDAATERCSLFINKWDVPGLAAELSWPVANAYACRAMFLRKASRLPEAIAQCDYVVDRFGKSADVDLQFEVAWTLVEKSFVLRKARRLAASVAAAKEVGTRFADTKDQRIVGQLAYAINAEGQALLCEGKVLMNNELHDEAVTKLEEAQRRFTEATEKGSEHRHQHLMSRSYTEFLLGQAEAAEATFLSAVAVDRNHTEWLDLKNWTELEMFPVSLDTQFLAATKTWLEKYRETGRY